MSNRVCVCTLLRVRSQLSCHFGSQVQIAVEAETLDDFVFICLNLGQSYLVPALMENSRYPVEFVEVG